MRTPPRRPHRRHINTRPTPPHAPRTRARLSRTYCRAHKSECNTALALVVAENGELGDALRECLAYARVSDKCTQIATVRVCVQMSVCKCA